VVLLGRYEELAEAATTPLALRRYATQAVTEIERELDARELGAAA
jgi:hypothetical protein